MKITEKQRETGVDIARKRGLSTIYINAKGEYFTDKNSAANSVGGKAEGYTSISVAPEAAPMPEKPPTAEELIARIEAATAAEEVEAILAAESAGKKRKTVLEAAGVQLALLTEAGNS